MNLIILVYVPNFFLSIPYVLTKADAYANSATLPERSLLWGFSTYYTFIMLVTPSVTNWWTGNYSNLV